MEPDSGFCRIISTHGPEAAYSPELKRAALEMIRVGGSSAGPSRWPPPAPLDSGVSTLRVPLFIVLLSTLIVVTWVQPYRNKPPIRSDGVGYHIWTHALLALDFRFCQLAERAGATGAISVKNSVTGICQNKYPPGVALLRLPFMAPFARRQFDADLGQPLITAWEHRISLALGALALFLTAIFCFWTLRRLEVSSGMAQCALFFALFGTGLFHYGTYDSSFSHVYSALLLAMLLWVLLGRVNRDPGWGSRAAVGLLTLFLILVRSTNIFLVALGAVAAWGARTRLHLLPLAIGAAGGASIQLVYNVLATGGMTFSSYGTESFVWDRPMWASVLLSYERGVFTYYPVLGVALVAGLSVRRTRRGGLACRRATLLGTPVGTVRASCALPLRLRRADGGACRVPRQAHGLVEECAAGQRLKGLPAEGWRAPERGRAAASARYGRRREGLLREGRTGAIAAAWSCGRTPRTWSA